MDEATLPDGTYDAIVVDAEDLADDQVGLELTVLAGPEKGRVVELRGPRGSHDAIDLLGIPATITVTDGTPSVRLEP